MPNTRVSPARSQGDIATPKRKKSRGSRSVGSPALSTASGRLTSLIDQFKDKNRQSFALSPLNSKSILNDNTDIEEPRRRSWWKKLGENSQAVMEVLEDNKVPDTNNLIEELIDIEVLSQEKKNITLDLPESSDNESINSIVLPQRKLFTQKENQPQKKFGQLIGNRESLAKLHKPNTTNTEKIVNVGARELFQNIKRSKPIFPAALLQISPNKTAADKTKENLVIEPKPQVRNIFGNRPTNKRKNIFADFIVSESEDEIPDIQPKVFGFQKKLELRRISSVSRGRDTSPTSSITTDIEMEDWKHLPSSTMVENQLEDMVAGHTPIKRVRLSKLSEAKESEAGTNTIQTNTTGDKTKQSNKSTYSKNKSKSSPEIKNKTLDNSRTTRSMAKNTSLREELHNTPRKQDGKDNKSQNKTTNNAVYGKPSEPMDIVKETTLNRSQQQLKIRNSTKATENEVESDENVRAVNNETKVIRKSSSKNKSGNIADKSLNNEDKDINGKESTDGNTETQDTSNKTGSNINDNQEDDDEHNFTLQYENEMVENEVVMNISEVEKDIQKEEIYKPKNNKSLHQVQKQTKITEELELSQQNKQNTADDKVDGKQENNQEAENQVSGDQKDAVYENEPKGKKSYLIENELNKSEENEEEINPSQEIEDEDIIANKSQEIQNESENEEGNVTGVVENEVNDSKENMSTASDVDENEHEADISNVNNEEANASEEVGEEGNTMGEDEEEADKSKEDEDGANESQEVEAEFNESQEADVTQNQEIEEEPNESVVENDDVSDEENNEEIEEDEEETANDSQEVSTNENQVESEADESESEEVEHDQQMNDSDEADKAIATDVETSEQDYNDEIEVDDDEQEPHEEVDETEQNQVEQNEIEPSDEVIEESPDVTHDTTGRNRKRDLNKSPEVILNKKADQMDSFTAKGRNTSARKTKSMIKNLNIRPSLAPPRDSVGFSDGTTNSSAEGSGWDSHRTTRKTLRQTFGKDFTPRKSLRALVMEKSAKRHTEHVDLNSETIKFPQANSTELPEDSNRVEDIDVVESDHELSKRTRLTTLETYLQKIKQQNIEKNLKMEEAVRNSLNRPTSNSLSLFKVPNKPAPRRPKPAQNKQKKQIKSITPFGELPPEMIADLKYKPPKRFQPSNASWITKRLYKYLENKLEARYDYKARVRAEKLVETIYHFAKDIRRHAVAPAHAVDVLKHEMARLDIVHTHFEFYRFFHDFMPREIRIKVNPDIVNNIPLPRHGVFSEILQGVKG